MVAPIGPSGLFPVPSTGVLPAERGESGKAPGFERDRREPAAGTGAPGVPQVEILRSDPAARSGRVEGLDRRPVRPGGFGFEDAGSRAERLHDDDFEASPFDGNRAGYRRPRPSSQFLAQAIGQELGGGSPRDPQAVAGLYRQTREAVDRVLFPAPATGDGTRV